MVAGETIYQQEHPRLCEMAQSWYFPNMSAGRIEHAMARITAAMERIDAARPSDNSQSATPPDSKAGSAKVLALVNAHEKLREEVADTIGEIDALIEELEGE